MVEDVESSPIRLSLQGVRDASLISLNFYLRKKTQLAKNSTSSRYITL